MIATEQDTKIWLYDPTIYPPNFLYGLWTLMSSDIEKVLWYKVPLADSEPPSYSVFESHIQKETVLFIVQDVVANGQVAGIVWFDGLQDAHRAFINVFYRKEFRGKRAIAATSKVEKSFVDAFKCKHLWAMTPWKEAKVHGLEQGYKSQTLKDFVLIRGISHDVYMLHKEVSDGRDIR